eukprot:PLAT13703.1.p1 GENE.PLAT13703.1~~PLAT13703.1.p1  ORF type:complete len:558 (+),score=97.35 PLAT13703.1:120-1676(+)
MWEVLSGTALCELCGDVVLHVRRSAVHCMICDLRCHEQCFNRARKRAPKCKGVAHKEDEEEHSWRTQAGVLECDRCEVSAFAMQRCLWCGFTGHSACAGACQLEADAILPPRCVVRSLSPSRGVSAVFRQHRVVWELKREECDGTPLLVLVNGRSGGQQGRLLLAQFRKALNPLQVWDLAQGGPDGALRLFSQLKRFRVLVCGGDGTVGWVLDALDRLDVGEEGKPRVAILPLGTGNDLSRVLGWGGGHDGQLGVKHVLQTVATSHEALLDRWTVSFTSAGGGDVKMMNNYFGIGVDAQVALRFHKMRQQKPWLFVGQLVNKLWYTHMGLRVFLQGCPPVASLLSLTCDGEPIDIPPEVQGIIVLNIGSYAGGVDLWGADDGEADATDSVPSVADGKLEVVGVYGSLHMAQLKCQLARSLRLAQCSQLSVRLRRKAAVQVDGEPWMQPAGDIHVCSTSQARMLRPSREKSGEVAAVVSDVLTWAAEADVITLRQQALLQREFSRRVALQVPPEDEDAW